MAVNTPHWRLLRPNKTNIKNLQRPLLCYLATIQYVIITIMSDLSVNLLGTLKSTVDASLLALIAHSNDLSAIELYILESDRSLFISCNIINGIEQCKQIKDIGPYTQYWKNINANLIKPKVNDLMAECIQCWHAFICHDPDASKECTAKEPSNY